MERYEGRPFLRLLECYVLDCIGQLQDVDRDTLVRMEPKLREIYEMDGSWLDIVKTQMVLPESLSTQIEEIWLGYLDNAKKHGNSVDPEEFAIAFVDENFSDDIE